MRTMTPDSTSRLQQSRPEVTSVVPVALNPAFAAASQRPICPKDSNRMDFRCLENPSEYKSIGLIGHLGRLTESRRTATDRLRSRPVIMPAGKPLATSQEYLQSTRVCRDLQLRNMP
jgi:hypothetical protein